MTWYFIRYTRAAAKRQTIYGSSISQSFVLGFDIMVSFYQAVKIEKVR